MSAYSGQVLVGSRRITALPGHIGHDQTALPTNIAFRTDGLLAHVEPRFYSSTDVAAFRQRRLMWPGFQVLWEEKHDPLTQSEVAYLQSLMNSGKEVWLRADNILHRTAGILAPGLEPDWWITPHHPILPPTHLQQSDAAFDWTGLLTVDGRVVDSSLFTVYPTYGAIQFTQGVARPGQIVRLDYTVALHGRVVGLIEAPGQEVVDDFMWSATMLFQTIPFSGTLNEAFVGLES